MTRGFAGLRTVLTWVASALTASAGVTVLAPAAFTPPGSLDAGAARTKPAAAWRGLDAAVAAVVASGDPFAAARRSGFVVRDERVQVVVECADSARTAALAQWLEGAGCLRVSHAFDRVQADVSVELLRSLAGRPEVRSVRRPSYVPRTGRKPAGVSALSRAGTYTTEGVAAMNAPAWHTAGHTGQGVKVGVIDGELAGWDTLRGSELPEAAKVHFQAFGGTAVGDGGHGTACAEVIHDIAPSAELYLAVVSTEVDIANAADWMQSNGVSVISMSLGWLSWGPGDGTGYTANVVNSFVNAGGVWANSAGNSRLAHWQGSWRDDDGDGYLEFATDYEVNYITVDGVNIATVPVGTTINASMIWNQWSSPATDLDFHLVKSVGGAAPVIVHSADGPQSGGADQLPVEEFVYEVTEEASYGFVVEGLSGPANVDIEFFNRLDGSPLQFNVQDGSITPPADAAGALAAAALDADSPFTLESYSSRGPTNGPGGSLGGGAIKPDIAAYAVVSTQTYGARGGGNGFNGTSAACPHVAGAAALVRSGYPAYTGAQVRSFLEGRAINMGPAGKDVDYGIGRLTLGNPPSAACDPPAVPGFVSVAPNSPGSGIPYTITWTAAANATGYELQEATSSNFAAATTVSVAGTSAQRTHSVASDTTYYYRVRAVRACTGQTATSSYSSTLTVYVAAGGATTTSLWVPVATRATGANSSQWRTDLGLLNLGGATATCTVVYKSGATVKSYQTTVAGGRHVILRDIVGPSYLAGSGSGSLEVRSTQAVLVTSRTYNQNANGTFGQDYASNAPDEGLGAGQTATLPHLTENASYRSNIGLVNMGAAAATVTVSLVDGATGAQVGSYTVTLQAGEWKQDNQPFSKRFGRNNLEAGYARVTVTAGSGVVAVASVIDNNANSNDPTTITMQR